MKLRTQVLVGVLLVVIGMIALLSNLLDIDFGAICWPLFFILAGIWIVVRPRIVSENTSLHMLFLGDLDRSGEWQVADQEIWSFITDVDLDFTQAQIPDGETLIKMYSFVGDLDILLPEDVGFKINSFGFITDANIQGVKQTGFFMRPIQELSENYETATKKINIEQLAFIGELKVRSV